MNRGFKVGLQFKRRFWEEDDGIYGGITYTDQPISNISYPSTGLFTGRAGGVLLGGYIFGDSLPDLSISRRCRPQDQIKAALEQGSKIHPQYTKEFKNGVARGLASRALDPGLLRPLDRREPRQELRQYVRHRWPHRAGGRALLAPAGLAGRRGAVRAGCDQAAAQARAHGIIRHHWKKGREAQRRLPPFFFPGYCTQLVAELFTHASQCARLKYPWGVPGAFGSAVCGSLQIFQGSLFTSSMIFA